MTATAPLDPAACRALVASGRWAAKVAVTEAGCWLWTGYVSRDGYGQIRLDGRMRLAHRVALVAALGRDLEPGMQASHGCHDRAFAAGECVATDEDPCAHRRCVNPDPTHLVEQSARENNLAGGTLIADRAARTHCPAGHPLEPGNLRRSELARGWRACLTCGRQRSAEHAAAVRTAHRALGLAHRDYTALFGQSRTIAEAVTARIAEGVRPAVLVESARIAAQAAETESREWLEEILATERRWTA